MSNTGAESSWIDMNRGDFDAKRAKTAWTFTRAFFMSDDAFAATEPCLITTEGLITLFPKITRLVKNAEADNNDFEVDDGV